MMAAMSTFLGVLCLLAIAALSVLLARIGLLTETRADGGRYIATALFAAPYLVALLLGHLVALARGGFAPLWPGGPPVVRGLLVLALALGAAAVAIVAVGMLPGREEAASAILARRLVWIALLTLLMAAVLLAMFPAASGAWGVRGLRVAMASMLIVSVIGAVLLIGQARRAEAERAAARDRPIPGLTAPREPDTSGRR